VEIEYRQTNPLADGPLVPQSALDPRIRLFDNKVTCGSCHSSYSDQDHELVMSNLGSKLCLGCHQY
jgi:predicted CXXCH cytochrome family protein